LQDGAEKELGTNSHGLDQCDSVQEDEVGIAFSGLVYNVVPIQYITDKVVWPAGWFELQGEGYP